MTRGIRFAQEWPLRLAIGVLLAAAIIYHGAAQRYSLTHLSGPYLVRFDRLTGRGSACQMKRAGGGLALDCGAAAADSTDPYRALTTPSP